MKLVNSEDSLSIANYLTITNLCLQLFCLLHDGHSESFMNRMKLIFHESNVLRHKFTQKTKIHFSIDI